IGQDRPQLLARPLGEHVLGLLARQGQEGGFGGGQDGGAADEGQRQDEQESGDHSVVSRGASRPRNVSSRRRCNENISSFSSGSSWSKPSRWSMPCVASSRISSAVEWPPREAWR